MPAGFKNAMFSWIRRRCFVPCQGGPFRYVLVGASGAGEQEKPQYLCSHQASSTGRLIEFVLKTCTRQPLWDCGTYWFRYSVIIVQFDFTLLLSLLVAYVFAWVKWRVRLPRGLVSPFLCLPTCVPVVGWRACFPEVLSPLSPHMFWMVSSGWCPDWGLVSHCFALPPIAPPVPLSSSVSPHVCLCWMACPSSGSFLLSPHCLPSCFPVLVGVSTFLRPCLSLSPSLSPSLSLVLFPFLAVVLFWIFLQTVYR